MTVTIRSRLSSTNVRRHDAFCACIGCKAVKGVGRRECQAQKAISRTDAGYCGDERASFKKVVRPDQKREAVTHLQAAPPSREMGLHEKVDLSVEAFVFNSKGTSVRVKSAHGSISKSHDDPLSICAAARGGIAPTSARSGE